MHEACILSLTPFTMDRLKRVSDSVRTLLQLEEDLGLPRVAIDTLVGRTIAAQAQLVLTGSPGIAPEYPAAAAELMLGTCAGIEVGSEHAWVQNAYWLMGFLFSAIPGVKRGCVPSLSHSLL